MRHKPAVLVNVTPVGDMLLAPLTNPNSIVSCSAHQVMLTVDLTVHHFQMVIHSLEKNGQFLVCADTAQLQGTRGSVLEAPTPCEARRAAAGCPRLTRSELVFSMERMQVPPQYHRVCSSCWAAQ